MLTVTRYGGFPTNSLALVRALGDVKGIPIGLFATLDRTTTM